MAREVGAAPHAPRPLAPSGANISPKDSADYAKRMVQWQIEEIEMQPSNNRETAAARARDARTLNELARTLERLDKLEKSRVSKEKKSTKAEHEQKKADLIRRLDKLAAPGGTGPLPAKSGA